MQNSIFKQSAVFAHQSAPVPPGVISILHREEWLLAIQALLTQTGMRRGFSVAVVSLAAYTACAGGDAPCGYIVAENMRQVAAGLRESRQRGIGMLYVLFPAGGRDIAAMRLRGGACFAGAAGQVCFGVAESRELPRALQAGSDMLLLRIAEVRLEKKEKIREGGS